MRTNGLRLQAVELVELTQSTQQLIFAFICRAQPAPLTLCRCAGPKKKIPKLILRVASALLDALALGLALDPGPRISLAEPNPTPHHHHTR